MSYFGNLAPCIALTVGSLLMGTVGQAANIAYDSAADAVYSDGTMNGRNGGTVDGFGAWNVVNVKGGDAGWGGSWVPGNDWANTNTPAFRINASEISTTDGYRPLTGGALASGQSVVLTGLLLGNSPTGGEGGFALTDASNTQLIKVYAKGNDGSNGYYVDDATGTHALTGVGYNWRSKLNFTFTLGDSGAYTLSATGASSGSYAGTISTVTGGVSQVDLFAYRTNDNGQGDVDLESLAVTAVPEPASIALLGLASVSLLARRRRA